jgi:parallel beta-helix repeat protein
MSGNTVTHNSYYGVGLDSSSNNSIIGNTITNNTYGIQLYYSSNYNSMRGNTVTDNIYLGIGIDWYSNNNSIHENTVTNNSYGVGLYYSSNFNSVSGNTVTSNYGGIWLESSSNFNSISENTIANNTYGVGLGSSSNNSIYHNNLVDNANQIQSEQSSNVWDDGYPSGGNYWSDYDGTDADHDGIGDTSYVIDANNADRHPLMTLHIIPELPLFFFLPLFMIATLQVVTIYGRKRGSE